MVRLIILCPGQGYQHPNMFRLSPNVFHALSTYLTAPLLEVLQSPELLFKNQNAQMLVVASAYANWMAIKPYIPEPLAFLGYSVGEVTAFSAAGAIHAKDVLPLIHQRVFLMEEARAKHNESMRMLAVTGIDKKTLSTCCQKHKVYKAITISSSSFVLGGLGHALEKANHFLSHYGAHTQWLPIDIASHTPLMNEASNEFAKVLTATPFNEPFLPVISSLTTEKIRTGTQAKLTLASQLSHPLEFEKCLQVMNELLPTCILELGPGTALSKMALNVNPAIACRSMDEFYSIEGVIEWINKH
jgi:[acyl-carrier-protein] S-malonyltransferase